jgi:hypothetical protein
MLAWYERSWCCMPVVPVWFDRALCGLSVVPRVIVCCVWFQPNARRAVCDSVLHVVPTERLLCRRDRVRRVIPINARYAGVVRCRMWFQPNARCAAWFRAGVVGEGERHANDGGQPAEQHVAADRFAREIVRFLTHVRRCACGAELNRSAAAERGRHTFFRVYPARFLNARCARAIALEMTYFKRLCSY